MKKAISLILVLLLCLPLGACGYENEGIETTGVKEENTSQDGHKNTQEEKSNSLLGAWYSDAEGIVIFFSESGNMTTCLVECAYNDNPTVGIHDEKYKLGEKNQLETYGANGDLNVIYDYKINGDILNLSLTSANYNISLNKASKSTQFEEPLVGQWKLLSMGYVESPSYQYWKYDVTFYSDGTFVSKHEDYVTGDEKITNSRYRIIHDGSTIEMEFTTYSYWDYMFLSNDVMLVTTENSQLLYIAQ